MKKGVRSAATAFRANALGPKVTKRTCATCDYRGLYDGGRHATEGCTTGGLTASLVRTFPAKLREQVLRESAETAAHDYESDRDLTDFEAFD